MLRKQRAERGTAMSNKIIGIIGNDNIYEAMSLQFSSNGFECLLLQVDENGKEIDLSENKSIRIKNIRGRFVDISLENRSIRWVKSFEELSGACLLIEALHGDIELKQKVIKEMERVSEVSTPIMSNGRLYFPSKLSEVLKDSSRFFVTYLYDVEFMSNNGEIIIHDKTSEEQLKNVKQIYEQAKFNIGIVKEKIGFVHNRLGLLNIMSLMKFFDEKLISLESLKKYVIVTAVGPGMHFNLTLGKEIKFEMVESIDLMKELSRQFGNDRFRIPEYFKYENITLDNIFDYLAKDEVNNYSIPDSILGQEEDRKFKHIYVKGLDTLFNNFLIPLLRYADVIYLDEKECSEYLEKTELQSKDLHAKILKKAVFFEEQHTEKVDLIIDFSLEEFKEKVESCNKFQNRFGKDVPILLNTPIYKIDDIAQNTSNPAMIYGMYTQKSYLQNTELVVNDLMNKEVYVSIRRLIKNIASEVVETKDTYVRPLAYVILAKLIDSVLIVEEGIAGMQDVERIGVDGQVFKYIDTMGLDRIKRMCDYLEPIYGRNFAWTKTFADMLEKNETFY